MDGEKKGRRFYKLYDDVTADLGFNNKLLAYLKMLKIMDHKTGKLPVPLRVIAEDNGISLGSAHILLVRARADRGIGLNKNRTKNEQPSEVNKGLEQQGVNANRTENERTINRDYRNIDKQQLQQQSADGASVNPENLPLEIKIPKPPTEKHHDFHRLSFKFYEYRKNILGDEYFDPWDGKNFKQCERILKEKANGNLEEAERRARHLALWNRIDPDYWKMTPGHLLSKWADLHEAPAGKNSRAEYTDAKNEAKRAKIREKLKNE